jgi:hypothetical protein
MCSRFGPFVWTARFVECVVLAHIASGLWYLNSCCIAINGMAAIVLYVGSGGVMYGSSVLMMVAGCMVVIGRITRGRSERVQVLGHCVNASCDIVQLTSGLWALSQSVPKMIS